MANIGSFRKSGQEYLGEIITLSLQTKGVRIVPRPAGPTAAPPVTGSMPAVPITQCAAFIRSARTYGRIFRCFPYLCPPHNPVRPRRRGPIGAHKRFERQARPTRTFNLQLRYPA